MTKHASTPTERIAALSASLHTAAERRAHARKNPRRAKPRILHSGVRGRSADTWLCGVHSSMPRAERQCEVTCKVCLRVMAARGGW